MANIWENAVITNKGIALQAKTLSGGTIEITSVKAGSGSVPVTTLMAQTAVSDIKQTLSIQPLQNSGNTVIIPVRLSNDEVSTSYDLMQVGFYATDPEEGEILYAIAQCTEAKNIPSTTEMPGYSLIWNFHFTLSNDVNLTATVTAAGMATVEDLNAGLATKMDKENPVGTGSFSMNRKSDTIVGEKSHAEGNDTEASGNFSHAEGNITIATGLSSHAEGYDTEASGYYSHAEGWNSIASGYYSHAEGGNTTTGYPRTTTASGSSSHAEGTATLASGDSSHAEGVSTQANSNGSHSEGYQTLANGRYSHAEGYKTEALDYQHAQGHYNDTSKSTAASNSGTTGTLFVIGNGTSSTASNALRVTGAGATIAKQAYSTSGADYAEFFEWYDGNLKNEDRVGYFVTFADGRFIKKAEEGDYILGIVSGNPSVIGNYDECWMGQNLMDEWGRFIFKEYTEKNPETGETETYTSYDVNPEYNSEMEYTHREDRPEWSAIGMLGTLSVRDDGTCQVNGYCKCTAGGIATASERGIDTYRVIERVTDNIVKVIFK